MFRLTREVRFAINREPDDQLHHRPTNSYAGYPSLTGLGTYLTLQITLAGELDARSSYLRNIKEIDDVVRRKAIPALPAMTTGGMDLPCGLMKSLKDAWPGATLEEVRLAFSPFLSASCCASENPMVRLSQKFEFSASHRLHNRKLSDDENRKTYGKCNNAQGHGHNYEVQVTLIGTPDERGVLIDIPTFERTVAERVIDRFDHKHLNSEVSEFQERGLIPSVENIARVIYDLLKSALAAERSKLASVTVWETPKTWCEYTEG